MSNKKIVYVFLLICLCIFLCGTSSAEYPNTLNLSEIKDNFSIGTPVYDIYSGTKYLEVNENEAIEIEYFLTGVGQVDANKIRISISPDICQESIISVQTIEANWTDIENKRPSHLEMHSYQDGSQMAGILPPYYFTVDEADSFFNYGGKPWQSVNDTLLVVPWVNGSLVSPIYIRFVIAEDAPKGDHEVMFFVFYQYDDTWYSTQENVTVHIKYWYEQWYYQILLALSVPVLYAILSSFYKCVYNKSTSFLQKIKIWFIKILVLIKEEVKKLNPKKRVKSRGYLISS